jgi:hypothetical protein
LSAGQSKDGVVNKNHGYLFAPMRSVDDFTCSDGGQVTVTLIGKDYLVGVCPFHSRRHGRRSSVRYLNHIDVEVIIR